MAFTYASEGVEKTMRPLVETLGAELILKCDVSSDEEIQAVFKGQSGTDHDYSRFSGRPALPGVTRLYILQANLAYGFALSITRSAAIYRLVIYFLQLKLMLSLFICQILKQIMHGTGFAIVGQFPILFHRCIFTPHRVL